MAIVKFYGSLKQYGDKYKIEADTASEAMNCLYQQIKGLRKQIIDGYFRVRIAKTDLSEETIQFGLHHKLKRNDVIHVVPVINGAKSGLFTVIAGAVMVTAGAVAMFGFGQPWGASLMAAGVGLMIGGIAQMLTKIPKTSSDDSNTNNNTSFSNLDNTIGQGLPVPVCYGEMLIGSRVLSQGIETI